MISENIMGLEVDEALSRFINSIDCADYGFEKVSLLESNGRILYEDIISDINVPSFPKSAMDGYAVYSKDIADASTDSPVRLKVIGELFAGDYKEIKYEPMTAIRIMTGAFVPEGYDCIVKQEDTDLGECTVQIFSSIPAYRNYCPIGEDIKKGTSVLKKGTRITPLHIGILASLGIASVKVQKRLKCAILSTGSEILIPGTPLSPGKIYNNSAYIMAAFLQKEGICVNELSIAADEQSELAKAIEKAVSENDFVITTGGVSVGKKDFLPSVLESINAEIIFYRANIQPGTPTIGAVINGTPLLGLSGNPYAALANFELYFWAMCAKMTGCEDLNSIKENAVFKGSYSKKNIHRRLLRAAYRNGSVSLLDSTHASSVISNMTMCNCYINLEAGRCLNDGDTVEVIMFH